MTGYFGAIGSLVGEKSKWRKTAYGKATAGAWSTLSCSAGCVKIALRPSPEPGMLPLLKVSIGKWNGAGPDKEVVIFEGPIPQS